MRKTQKSIQALFGLSISIQQLNKRFEANHGATLLQWYLLRILLDEPGISALHLANSIGVHPSTLTQLLKRLLAKELILVLEDPLDSRKRLITITRIGKELHDQMTLKVEEIVPVLHSIQGELTTAQLNIADLVLNKFKLPQE